MKEDSAQVRRFVQRAAAGDIAAFEKLVVRFQSMAWAYAYAHLGDPHLAEDVAQEAFVDAYRQMANLRAPEAFSAWLRTILFKHCDRLTRRNRLPLVSLDSIPQVRSGADTPEMAAEASETNQQVRGAIRSLTTAQRQVTTLYYLDAYSQKEIAVFLEVPVSTVKKRLHDARLRIKERMIGMVGKTLSNDQPDELFSQRVIEELLDRPRPLEIPGHPVHEMWKQIAALLSSYDIVAGEEVVEKEVFPSVQEEMDVSYMAYHTGRRILRTHMTHTTFQAIRGRKPPVRLLAAGRVFRPDQEDATHSRVFHQVDGVCIDAGANDAILRSTCEQVLESVLENHPYRWRQAEFPFVDGGLEFDIEVGGAWVGIGGCGLLKPSMLSEAGYDPQAVSGFAFGVGLDRLVMTKLGLQDIHALWQPPYVDG